MSGAGREPGFEPGFEADDALAAEYALGTLGAREAAEVRRRVAAEPELAAAVERWEQSLQPLSGLALPESPPADLWARIERSIAPGAGEVVRAPRRGGWATWLLGGWAGVATAAAAVLLVLWQTPAPAPLMTVMLTDRSQTAWTAAVGRDGALRLAAVAPVGGGTQVGTQVGAGEVPGDRALQLWALPPGATVPTSLGLLPRGERRITLTTPAVRPVTGMLIEITLEPQGGSPTGRPTGPVQFIGRLSEAGPPT